MPSSTTRLSCISFSSLLFPSISSFSSFFSYPSCSFSSFSSISEGLEGLQALSPLLQGPVGQVQGCLLTGLASSSTPPSTCFSFSSALLATSKNTAKRQNQNNDKTSKLFKKQNIHRFQKSTGFKIMTGF